MTPVVAAFIVGGVWALFGMSFAILFELQKLSRALRNQSGRGV